MAVESPGETTDIVEEMLGVTTNTTAYIPQNVVTNGTGSEMEGGLETPAIDETHSETLEAIEDMHEATSSHINNLSVWLDSFFDDPEYTEEKAQGRVRVKQSMKISRYKSDLFRSSIRASVDLPNLEKRWRLVFEDEILPEENAYGDYSSSVDDTFRASSIGSQYIVSILDDIDTRISAGYRFNDESFYVGPRVRLRRPINEDWSYEFANRLRWYSATGFRINSHIDFERQVLDDCLFEQRLAGDWSEKREHEQALRLSATTSLSQPLSKRRALRYEFDATYWTKEYEGLKNITLSVAYRSRLWKEWLAYEVTPFVSWDDDLDWKPNPGVILSMTVSFEEDRPRR